MTDLGVNPSNPEDFMHESRYGSLQLSFWQHFVENPLSFPSRQESEQK